MLIDNIIVIGNSMILGVFTSRSGCTLHADRALIDFVLNFLNTDNPAFVGKGQMVTQLTTVVTNMRYDEFNHTIHAA